MINVVYFSSVLFFLFTELQSVNIDLVARSQYETTRKPRNGSRIEDAVYKFVGSSVISLGTVCRRKLEMAKD